MTRSNKWGRKPALSVLALMVASAWQTTVSAQDIDIFLNNTDDQDRILPNVLLIVGNQSSWSRAYTVEGVESKKEAVSVALATVSQDDSLVNSVNLGMMLPTQAGGTDGGKVVKAVAEFTTASKDLYKCLVYKHEKYETRTVNGPRIPNPNGGGWITPQITYPGFEGCYPKDTPFPVAGHPDAPNGGLIGGYALEDSGNMGLALTLHEAYLYFKGAAADAGLRDDGNLAKYPAWPGYPYAIYSDARVNNGTNANSPKLVGDPNAFASGSAQYLSPAHANRCASNFIILINTGDLSSNEDGPARTKLQADSGTTPEVIRLTPSNYESSWSDEYAAFLSSTDVDPDRDGDQSIITYVIDVFDPNVNDTTPQQAQRALLKSIAARGKGRYFAAADADDVATALTQILTEVQAVNTSFASASMPISMTAETQGTNENQVYIGMFRPDETGRPRWMGNLKRYQYQWDAVLQMPYLAGATGSAAYDPVTGFINTSTSSYWTHSSTYWNNIPGYDTASDAPDGPVVEKGATGQVLRDRLTSAAARRLLTCDGSCSNGDALQTLTLPDEMLNSWVQGYDMANDTGRANPAEGRPSIHGDVLHSRPLVVNYNGGGGEDVVVFYGANDGFFRAIRGSDGNELWAMSFLEHQSQFQQLYDNQPDPDGEELLHPYFMDGSPTAYLQSITRSNGDRYIDSAWLYLTMRRGGDFLYALDVSSVNSPKFLWKIQGGEGRFPTLGETWSSPKPAFVRARVSGDNPRPVLFFGAGYDAAAEDYVPGTGGRPGRSRGQGIYMVDAETGEFLWFGTAAGMNYSIPGDLTLINFARSTENFADRIYFADTGGNIWRADIGEASTSNWTVRKVASLGGSCSATSDADCRKFLYNPSAVVETDGSVSLLIGSGDREHPLESTVQNRMYLVRDRGQAWTMSDSNLQEITSTTSSIDAAKIRNGWYFDLRTGEKLVGNTLTQSGVAYFNTNTPAAQSDDSCVTGLGVAREYMVEYADPLSIATYLSDSFGEVVAGGGFPPPPVPMTLKFGDTYWSGVGGLKPTSPGTEQPGTRQKTFWARDIDAE